ncbi:hypothetical protein [Candidatus Aalborgicola defluviihabitans]|uniref:hypothetical protein n=1 Tax=Candidatus Aalborgicola defluviihabitans TaxID=3386187 RepID=UPI0039B90B74
MGRLGDDADGWLSKERIIAHPGFSRWLVPPAALAIHLSIGMAYGFSVFWLPLSKALGIKEAIKCGPEVGFFGQLFTTSCDWSIATHRLDVHVVLCVPGSGCRRLGRMVGQVGPRKVGVLAALCWGGGMLISAMGIYLHQFWMMVLGSGVIGGIGLGLGYISPVSTLIKWFPDKRGMATGMASWAWRRCQDWFATGSRVDEVFRHANRGGRMAGPFCGGVLYIVAMLCGAWLPRFRPVVEARGLGKQPVARAPTR